MRRFKLSRVLLLGSKIEPDIQEKLTVCACVFAAYKMKLNHRQPQASPSLSPHTALTPCQIWPLTYLARPGNKRNGWGVEWVWWVVGGGDPFVIEASPLQFDLLPVNVPGIAAARLKKIGFRRGGGVKVGGKFMKSPAIGSGWSRARGRDRRKRERESDGQVRDRKGLKLHLGF